MNAFYVDNFSSKSVYHMFLSYMIAHSDAFSLVYFQYSINEKPHEKVSLIREALSRFEIFDKDVDRWPGTKTRNFQGHIYHLRAYKITFPTVFEILDVLETADSLWDWDYPEYPMDLCFYKNGMAWFASSVHEHWNALYTDSIGMINDLQSIGLQISQNDSIDDAEMYYDEGLLPKK